jgi:manganese transport protein
MDDSASKSWLGSLRSLLAVFGPGLFLIGYNIGTGSVTTMASAGSRWGMLMTWVVLLSCVFVCLGIVLFGRYTLATGETVLYAIKRHVPFGKPVSLFIMTSVILGEYAGVAGMTAIMVDILREWIERMCGEPIAHLPLVLTLVVCGGVLAIMWSGKYAFLEAVLASLVAIMGICFLACAVLVVPSWKDIFTGLMPGVPREPGADMLVAGMAGTTFSAAMLYCRSITLKAKGWGMEQSRRALVDAGVSGFCMFLLSIAVMICAAGTLFVNHKPIEETIDMVKTLEPLAGKFAFALFIIGILGAGLSSLIPTILIAPWLISDYRGEKIEPKSWLSRGFVILGVIVGLAGPLTGFKPVPLMVATMALLAIVMPFSMVAITVLLNQKRMGPSKNTLLLNLGCASAIVFSLIMCGYGVIAFVGDAQKLLQK